MSDQRMDHAAAHERIEDLLLEPRRLAALERSTETDDVALREHLAGCAACAADLASWRRLHAAIGGALPTDATPASIASAVEPMEPPPSLRAGVISAVTSAAREADEASLTPVQIHEPRGQRMGRRSPLAPLLGLAAAIVLLVGGGFVVIDQVQQRAAAEASANELTIALAAVDRMLETDHRVVQLRDTTGASAGTISWSRHDWVVLTNALPEPPAGSTYRCWLIEAGSRSMAVGQMEFSGGVAFWAISVDQWQTWEINETTEFIVTLEPGDPVMPAGDIVLSARLSS